MQETLESLRMVKRSKNIQESKSTRAQWKYLRYLRAHRKPIIYIYFVALLQPLRITLLVAVERSPETPPTNPELAHA